MGGKDSEVKLPPVTIPDNLPEDSKHVLKVLGNMVVDCTQFEAHKCVSSLVPISLLSVSQSMCLQRYAVCCGVSGVCSFEGTALWQVHNGILCSAWCCNGYLVASLVCNRY